MKAVTRVVILPGILGADDYGTVTELLEYHVGRLLELHATDCEERELKFDPEWARWTFEMETNDAH
jgi:hypothetical protein